MSIISLRYRSKLHKYYVYDQIHTHTHTTWDIHLDQTQISQEHMFHCHLFWCSCKSAVVNLTKVTETVNSVEQCEGHHHVKFEWFHQNSVRFFFQVQKCIKYFNEILTSFCMWACLCMKQVYKVWSWLDKNLLYTAHRFTIPTPWPAMSLKFKRKA